METTTLLGISLGQKVAFTGAHGKRHYGEVIEIVTDSPAGEYVIVIDTIGARYCLHPVVLTAFC